MSGPAADVPDKVINSYREASLLSLNPYEADSVAVKTRPKTTGGYQKKSTEKVIPIPRSRNPRLK